MASRAVTGLGQIGEIMAKKKEQPAQQPRLDEKALREALSKIEGVDEEIITHAVTYGVVDDAYVVQTVYRVTSTTAEAIIKAYKESIGA